MDIVASRFNLTEHSTVSDVYVNGHKYCFWLEDPVREEKRNGLWTWKSEFKIPGKTAIPSGKYSIIVTRSQRFQRKLPLIRQVPDFTGVRIHPGNHAGNTEGCPLPGVDWSTKKPDWVGRSRKAFDPLYLMILESLLDGEDITLSIRNDF